MLQLNEILKVRTIDKFLLMKEHSETYDFCKPIIAIGLVSGCFDNLHSGHIAHLKEAKARCYHLIVSLTIDEKINKGPGRPVFTTQQRAYMLSALDCVDTIIINDQFDCCHIIEAIKPQFYFKGPDYKNGNDLHGALKKEKELLEKYGGEMIFTSDEITDSSTRIFSVQGKKPDLPYLDTFDFEYFRNLFEGPSDCVYKVLGDKIKDVYQYCKINGIGNKSSHVSATNIPYNVVEQKGGAEIIKEHLLSFAPDKTHFDFGEKYVEKVRYIHEDNGQKLFELQHTIENRLEKLEQPIVGEKITDFIYADFGHYFFSHEFPIQSPTKNDIREHLMVQANSANFGYNTLWKWKEFDPYHVSLDLQEGRLFVGNKNATAEEIIKKIYEVLQPVYITLTMGLEGLIIAHREPYTGKPELYKFPIIGVVKDAGDAMGCGDAVFAMTTLLISRGAKPEAIAFGGAIAGWLHSKVLGNTEALSLSKMLETAKTLLS